MNSKINNNPIQYVAIDISKATLHIQDDSKKMIVSNDFKGFKKLCPHLQKLQNPLVVFEATGGYERDLTNYLHHRQHSLTMVNPSKIRAFAQSKGLKAKTDPLDTRIILEFAQYNALQATEAPSKTLLELAALLDRRGHLTDALTQEKNRLQNSEDYILSSIKKMIKIFEKELVLIEKRIEALIASDSELQEHSKLFQSVKGVGKITAWTLLTCLKEMQQLERNALVALVGIAPFNRDSGIYKGKRKIMGGRAKVRKCLYMAAQTAAIHNPVISEYVKKLRARGKAYKCAIVAAMRKLLLHLRSLVKNSLIQKNQLSPCN